MYETVNDEIALEEVMAFLDHPPVANSMEDGRFGERLRQVLAASISWHENEAPRLPIKDDLRRRLEAVARKRNAAHPFGEHPDGIGPTLGMNVGRH